MEPEPTATGDSRDAVVSLFEPVGLELPESADNITVDQSPLEPFEDASLTSFTADTAEMKAICKSTGAMVAPDARIGPQDAKVLRDAELVEGSTLCSKDSDSGQGPAFRVVIPPSESGTVHVAIYQLPAGR